MDIKRPRIISALWDVGGTFSNPDLPSKRNSISLALTSPTALTDCVVFAMAYGEDALLYGTVMTSCNKLAGDCRGRTRYNFPTQDHLHILWFNQG